MITLMLNPAKPDQAELQDALAFMRTAFQSAAAGTTAFSDTEYAKHKQAAFHAMTRLGVQTWRQVKSLS
ncbi:Uncharacterised protein [Yersinia bercovieri]|nr:Uncharacterised protein [Yersinia bercovieri]